MRISATRAVLAGVIYTLLGHGEPPLLAQAGSPKLVAAPDLREAVTGGAVPCVDGTARGFECRNVDLVSFLPPAALGSTTPFVGGGLTIYFTGLWGWVDSATHREFVILPHVNGTAFVEITDPANPKFLGTLPLPAGVESPFLRDVKVYKNHAFIVSELTMTHGVQIFDLTQLREVKNTPAHFTETAHYAGIGSAHTLALNEATGYAYAAGGFLGCSGLAMIDVRNPEQPADAGCYADPSTGGETSPGYVHDTQCVLYHGPDKKYQGHEICLNSSISGVGIADVTNKQAPQPISVATYPNVHYAHQGWLTDDHRYFFLDDEEDGAPGLKTRTIVFDLADLDEPVVATEFLGSTEATDHNLYIQGRYMYQADYAAGLRVVDVADPLHPKEVGYFDTYPDTSHSNLQAFVGAFTSFPYFTDNIVAVSGMAEGLFLLRFRPPSP